MNKFVTILYILVLFYSNTLDAQIETTVYWNTPKGQASERLLAMTISRGADPEVAGDYSYRDQLDVIAPPFIRLFAAETRLDSRQYEQGWVITAAKKWDAKKIQAVLSAYPDRYKKQLLITIAGWPSWMDRDNDSILDADQTDAYSDWCARLVKIVNIEQGWDIPYWTPFHEAEDKIENGAAGLAGLYRKCAAAMKRVDLSIKVGGGEFNHAWDNDFLDTFIINTRGQLDFFTYHHTIIADKNKPESVIQDGAAALAGLGSSIRDKLNRHGLDAIPLWITGYNMVFPGDRDPLRGSKEAVFHALVLKYLAERGKVDGCNLWTDCDNQTGLMSNDYKPRPVSRLLALKNRYLTGSPVKTTSQKPAAVNLFAVENKDYKSVLLINHSADLQIVDLMFDGWLPDGSSYDVFTITADKFDSTNRVTGMNLGKNIVMPAYSLLLLNFAARTTILEMTDKPEIPASCELSPAFPNPFNSTAVIQFSVVESQNVKLLLVNARGQLLQELYQGWAQGGLTYTAGIDGSKLASGQYQVYLMGDEISATRSLTLIR
ncbi:MAG TPA: hypothetical protein PLP19_13905 [bacterium]|nr:hypothetical protein [bacterium]HPN44582.1 hypothetical protein [bacterium]